jgi:hypothetical protein
MVKADVSFSRLRRCRAATHERGQTTCHAAAVPCSAAVRVKAQTITETPRAVKGAIDIRQWHRRRTESSDIKLQIRFEI